MKITKLTISNFLKLKDVTIDPTKVNIVVGKNRQGKTSILKAIQVAFTGKADEKMIHDSEAKAEITVDLDEYRIERTLTHSGNYLKVANKDGWQVPAPQKFLDGLIGQFSFNPIEFFNLKSAEKKKYLLQAIDIKLTPEKLEAILGEKVQMDLNRHGLEVVAELHKHYYQKRTVLNASVSKKEKTVAELSEKIPPDFDRSQTGAALAAGIDQIRKSITLSEVSKTEKNSLMEKGKKVGENVRDWIAQVETLQKKIETGAKEMEEIKEQVMAIKVSDTSELEKQLVELESRREVIQTAKQIDETSAELSKEQAEQTRVDTIVKRLSQEVPDMLIKEANLPIEGLKVTEDAVTLNGVDVENLSSSEQLLFALNIARSLNQKFNIICVDGLEILDKETFEWFCNEIEKDANQYFVTRVDGDKGLLVENGEVKKI